MSKSYWMTEQTGNFSNDGKDTFDPRKRYVGVRLQQAVPLLDRDWNELEDIRRYEEAMLRKWYIGNGSPDDGFKISALDPAANDFKIAAGRCLVDGFEAVNEPYFNIDIKFEEDLNKKNIPDELKDIFKTEGYPLSGGATVAQEIENEWTIIDKEERFIVRKEDETLSVYASYKRYLQQEGISELSAPATVRTDTVYLDVWIEEVTGDDDDALNNLDVGIPTCFRHKLKWRVKVAEDGVRIPDAEAHHYYYDIATIKWGAEETAITKIHDLRTTGLAVHLLKEATAKLTNNSVADALHRHSKLVASDGSPDPALSVAKGGNVGIGRQDPISNLHIKASPKQVPLILDYDEQIEWADTIKPLFKSLPNSSVVIGSPDKGALPFLWKDAKGETWRAVLNGERIIIE
jgi:hypothetical protein